ncbi:putative ABC transporter ATP-binding protein YxlF [Roseimaritima multifibrata]|uniref:Putative ABC transporter ATP-binding protein YxlF n=1 Tax=Roseimaritima multifibrata TaxID=1930274 RepID=A0A517MKY6_9BACT|nr:ABC transporter ATP-binding protein [Roseimaritima multifibrata]QDS95437.1 putative ABC transporter ATP-binding protein YxlF [Roseimaritima multifibrata]
MSASADDPIIEIQDLRKTYRSGLLGGNRLEALQGVSLDVRPGEVFGLLGPNGAGKTTLIKTLLGIVRKTSGQATLFGAPVGTSRSRYRIGYLPENLRVEKHHTARSALQLYGRLSGLSNSVVQQRTDPLLEKVGLQGRDRETVRRFSKGMYQRLGLAQALLHDPDLLILDEPTDGLDPVGRSEMRNLLRQLRDEGKTIFLNSHILQEVEAVCDRVAVMAKGTLRGVGSIAELTANREFIEYQVHVAGPVDATLAAIPDSLRKNASAVPLLLQDGSDGCELKLNCDIEAAGAGDLDAAVDGLRKHGLSIRHVQRAKQSLESAFFALVDDTSEEVR